MTRQLLAQYIRRIEYSPSQKEGIITLQPGLALPPEPEGGEANSDENPIRELRQPGGAREGKEGPAHGQLDLFAAPPAKSAADANQKNTTPGNPEVVCKSGAGEGDRTLDIQLGKLTLYH